MSSSQGFVKTVTSYHFWILPSIDDCIDGAQKAKNTFDLTLVNVKSTYDTTVDTVKNTYETTVDNVKTTYETAKTTQENTVSRVKSNFDQGILKGLEQTIMDLSLFVMSWRIWQTKTVQDWFKHFFIFSKLF